MRTILKKGGTETVSLTVMLVCASSAAGRTVTVTEVGTEEVFATAVYGNTPVVFSLPVHLHYRVSVDPIEHYHLPDPVEGTAQKDTPTELSLTYRPIVRYGFRRTIAESDPAARITYTFDAAGKTPFTMDLATSTPNYGDWEEFINEVATPVMLCDNGDEDYELDRDDQTKKADGTESDITDIYYGGNAMVRFGGKWKWVQRYEDDTYHYVTFADGQYDDTYHAYAHTNEKGEVQDAFYWGMFKGSYSRNRLRSIAGQSVMVSATRTVEVQRAQANGAGYDTGYKSGWDYIADLLTLISKTDNSQAAFGAGFSSGSNTAKALTGTTKTYGGFWGSTNGKQDVKVFWIEGFWGNVWEAIRGLVITNNTIHVKMVPPYNFDGAGYIDTHKTCTGKSGSYIKNASVTNDAGFVPYDATGSGTTYYCDGLWFGNNTYALVGGNWGYAGFCGSRSVTLYSAASATGASFGTRLSQIPNRKNKL